jgi:glycosyltransferase involved in cell wall biosynthesis
VKIAFFADSYKPYLSGVTNSAEILVNELRRLGHQVYVFAPHYPGHVDTDPDLFRFPSFASGYPKFRLAVPLVRHIPEIDLAHSHSPFQAGLLARFIARRRKIPLVYTFHTLFTKYVHYARFVPKPLAKMGIVGYLQAFCRGADQIIAPSELAKRVLRSWKIQQPIEVIPSGVEFSLLAPSLQEAREKLRAKYHIPANAKVLLYAGRITKEKNIPFLIQAFHALQAKDVYLALVGGGPLEKELRHHHSKHIILAGEVGYPEILHYYPIGDIFIFSSLTETQGMVLAEAKANGLPIVALFAGGLAGTVRSGIDGYLVPRNQGIFVEHVKRLLDDDALRVKMAKAAREDAEERFSSVAVAKRIETVYNSLIKERGVFNV